MSDIKPCPWCSPPYAGAVLRFEGDVDRTYHHVHCLDCGARGPEHKDEDDAIREWNRVSRAVTLAEEHVQPRYPALYDMVMHYD